ncbi:uncharacterized protein DEA37_0011157, partial [Paragonimus westermani]
MLDGLTKAPLKPYQRLEILRTFLITKLKFELVLGSAHRNTLRKIDRLVRDKVRMWLRLPKDTTLAFMHSKIDEHGLGIPCLETTFPLEQRSKCERLVNFGTTEVANIVQCKAVVSDLVVANAPISVYGILVNSKSEEDKAWREALVKTHDCVDLANVQVDKGGFYWLRNPRRVFPRLFIRGLQLRSGLLTTKVRNSRGGRRDPADSCCRGLCGGPESIGQKCSITHEARCARHNRVVQLIDRLLRARGRSVFVEPIIPNASTFCKPDLVVRSGSFILVMDVTIALRRLALHRGRPLRRHRCSQCGQLGHKDEYCRSRHIDSGPTTCKWRYTPKFNSRLRPKSVGRFLSLLTTCQVNAPVRRKFLSLRINGFPARLQLNTVSDITVTSENLWRTLGRPPIRRTSQSATGACGGLLQLTGQLQCCVSFRGTTINGSCYVSRSNLNFLGLEWTEQLGLFDLPIQTICNQVRSPAALCNSTAQIAQRPVPYADLTVVDPELKRFEEQCVLIPAIEPLTSPTVTATINTVRRPFSQHGPTETIVSDNGTQFTSGQFRESHRRNSNGQAERFVDTPKRALLKSRGEGASEEISQRLPLNYLTTPNKLLSSNQSPAKGLMDRKLRTSLTSIIPTKQPDRKQFFQTDTPQYQFNHLSMPVIIDPVTTSGQK